MPIPTAFDRTIGEIDTAARSVIVTLTTMHRAAAKDIPRMQIVLRQRLQDFCDKVADAADSAGQ
jgi:hypothetical protein